jgi:hypothetical protein
MADPISARICKQCNSPVPGTDKRQKYCSRECFENWRRANDRMRCSRERVRRNAYAAEYRKNNPEKVTVAIARVRGSVEGRIEKKLSDMAWYEANKTKAVATGSHNYHKRRITEPWAVLLMAARSRAKKRNQPFDLTHDWARSRWTGRCEVSGLHFAIGMRGKSGHIFAPSIDKIIPSKGYTKDNCRFVLFAVNALKHDGSDDDMYRIASAIMANKS